jgi:hypothetical protein
MPLCIYGISKYLFTWIYMSISCSGSKRGLASSSPCVSLCGGTMDVRRQWKGTMTSYGASIVWCSWQGESKMEKRLSGGENDQGWDDIFITVEGDSRVVRGGWPMGVVRIQCFDFGSRGNAIRRSIVRKWSRDSELVLAPWEESVTRHNGVVTSAWGETAPGRGKRGDDTNWGDANLVGPKNKENPCGRFSCYKWTVKI